MMSKIRAVYPDANIVAIDYDPSATRVNQENRIKLMLSVAKERLLPVDPNVKQPVFDAQVQEDVYAAFTNPITANT